MSSSINGTYSFHNNGMESEVVGACGTNPPPPPPPQKKLNCFLFFWSCYSTCISGHAFDSSKAIWLQTMQERSFKILLAALIMSLLKYWNASLGLNQMSGVLVWLPTFCSVGGAPSGIRLKMVYLRRLTTILI